MAAYEEDIRFRYKQATRRLTKPLKDWNAWLRRWERVMMDAQVQEMSLVTKPSIWASEFVEAVSVVKP